MSEPMFKSQHNRRTTLQKKPTLVICMNSLNWCLYLNINAEINFKIFHLLKICNIYELMFVSQRTTFQNFWVGWRYLPNVKVMYEKMWVLVIDHCSIVSFRCRNGANLLLFSSCAPNLSCTCLPGVFRFHSQTPNLPVLIRKDWGKLR